MMKCLMMKMMNFRRLGARMRLLSSSGHVHDLIFIISDLGYVLWGGSTELAEMCSTVGLEIV